MLKKSGQYLLLEDPCGRWPMRTFLARFKYNGPITMAQFKKELIANHCVEDYLGALEHPDFSQRKAPLDILRSKNPVCYSRLMETWKAKH
jgi:hypothetical protein